MHLQRNLAPASPTFEKEDSKKQLLPILPPPLEALFVPSLVHAVVVVSESDDDDSLMFARRRKKQVCIDESSNQSYEFERVRPDERNVVWYPANAYVSFRHERRVIAAAVQKADAEQQWSRALLQVYYAFRQFENAQDVADVLAATAVDMDEFTVGLEANILPALGQDFGVRRQHLLHQFYHLQHQCHFSSDQHREELLRDTSRLSSRAARLFAQYRAQVAAECAAY
eukprot:scaffold41328_cov183-Amphora_coffeaeformis.AAC.1